MASGKLTNLMNQLNKCREDNKELSVIFAETTKDLQNRLEILRKMVREKDKEIEELKLQIEAMTDEE